MSDGTILKGHCTMKMMWVTNFAASTHRTVGITQAKYTFIEVPRPYQNVLFGTAHHALNLNLANWL